MIITITLSLVIISIIAFCCMAHKRREKATLVTLAVCYYLLYVCVIGLICFRFGDFLDYVFNYNVSEQLKVLFVLLKIAFFVLIPMPMVLTYRKVEKMLGK